MNASGHTYECVRSHIWMRQVTHMNAPCDTYECVLSSIWMSLRKLRMDEETKYEWVMSHESCHTYECGMSYVWMRHVTHMNGSCHILSHMSHSVTHMNESCHTSHVTHMNDSCHTYEWGMSHIWMGHVSFCHTYGWVTSHESSHTYECAMS